MGDNTFMVPVRFAVFLLFVLMSLGTLWCEIEDVGDALTVTFGPWKIYCGMSKLTIPYQDICSYRGPQGFCEDKCSYSVGKVNTCRPGGLRMHGLCMICGKSKKMIIEMKEPDSICG